MFKTIADKADAKVVNVQKEQMKDLDAKKDWRNDIPREPMDDAKSEKRKGKNCDFLNEIAKNPDEIRTRNFFEDNEDLFKLIKTNQYPEGVLIYNLTKTLKLSLPDLERKIFGFNYSNIQRLLKKKGHFYWEGVTSKLKEMILSIDDKQLREKTEKELQKYLKAKVYNGFTTNDYPEIHNFKINNYPEGWLILNLCEINLLSDTALGKLIGYDDLSYHLTLHREFKGGRIENIKDFIANINDQKRKEKSFSVLSDYVESVVFNQLNIEGFKSVDQYLDFNPKKWMSIRLCTLYLMPIRDLGRAIGYEDIRLAVQREYDFSDVNIKRIREFIRNTRDIQKKDRAIQVFRTFLTRAIYFRYKMTDFPKYIDFKSEMHPALWLVIQFCSTYLIHPFELEKLIGSSELAKRLKVISYFTNHTIDKFREFVRKNGTLLQKESARKAIAEFLKVRNEEFKRYTGPRVQNLEKLSNYPKLMNHLEYVYKIGNFPDEILEGYHEFPRISKFNQQFRFISSKEKRAFIKKMISDGTIKKIINKNVEIPEFIYKLIELSKNKYHKQSEIYPTHNSPSHESVLKKILEEVTNSIGMEIPVWMWHMDHYLTGHIDLIILNRTVYVCDYKPEETPNPDTTRLSYSFMRSVPQVASYALVLKREFKVENIMCATFNKMGAWIYEPEKTLLKLNQFIKNYKQYKADDRPWEKYFIEKLD